MVYLSLAVIYTIKAQTLQFNQVKLITDVQETVPANKVWKIESVMENSARKSFSPYFIKINGNNIYFHEFTHSGKAWMDVAEIKIYYKENYSCSNTPTLYFIYDGYEGKTPFWGRKSTAAVQNNSNWHLVLTIAPQTTGNPLSITKVKLYISYTESGDVKLDITYMDGTTSSMTIPGYQSSVCQSGTHQFISADPGSWNSTVNYAEVPEAELYKPNTQLPIWLPAGTTLQAGDNVKYISVIEFNIVP